MYAVVYKDRVIVGPMEWNRGLYEGSLKKHGVSNTLPRIAPEQLPYVVNDDAKIMRVEEVRPEINPMVEYHYGPQWDVSADNAVATYEVHETPIESARNNFKQLAAEERWKKEVAGTSVTINDTTVAVDTTREARNLFVQKFMFMDENEVANWKFLESWIVLSKSDLGTIIETIDTHVQSAFDWEKTINDEITEATTKDELLEIKILESQEIKMPVE